jgi:hypothetical protein
MSVQSILQQLDKELADLNQAWSLLTGMNASPARTAAKKRTVSKQAIRSTSPLGQSEARSVALRGRWFIFFQGT